MKIYLPTHQLSLSAKLHTKRPNWEDNMF